MHTDSGKPACSESSLLYYRCHNLKRHTGARLKGPADMDCPPAIYCHRLRVTDEDIDTLGHTNNVRYVAWMQDAAIAHSTAMGWNPDRYQQHQQTWLVRRHEIEYLLPSAAGDPIVIYTWIATLGKVTSTRRFEIVHANSNALLARAQTNWVYYDRTRQRPTRVPELLRSSFEVDPRSHFHLTDS